MERADLEELILELLANAPSSFAALYGYLVRHVVGEYPRVEEILDIAASLEKRGWVRARRVTPEGAYAGLSDLDRARVSREYRDWLEAPGTDLSVDALSVDEVGLWWEMLPQGRAAWEKHTDVKEASRWALDYDERTRTITIQAEDATTAEQALASWLRLNPGIELLPETRVLNPLSEFRLRDGTTVRGGVLLESRYRERASHR